jgi:hypothetical protein
MIDRDESAVVTAEDVFGMYLPFLLVWACRGNDGRSVKILLNPQVGDGY